MPKNPYDFVPLEAGPKRSAEHVRSQAAFDAFSGELRCRLTTETPLFIHGEQQQGLPERRFARRGGQVAIPASGLKGLLRSTYETVTNSCLAVLIDNLDYPRQSLRVSQLQGYEACNDSHVPCPACALFGMVERSQSSDDQAQARAGRIYLTDAVPVDARPVETNDEPWLLFPARRLNTGQVVPLAGSPRPHHAPFYLDPATGNILGRKLYYHHRNYQESLKQGSAKIHLEAYSGTFEFGLSFHNLSEFELHHLIYAIELDQGLPNQQNTLALRLRHHLGYGKGFGLGTVRLHIVPASFRLLRPAPTKSGAASGGPERFLRWRTDHQEVWQVIEGWNDWKVTVLRGWGTRPQGSASLNAFRRLLAWPGRENYQYPRRKWFDDNPRVTLAEYQSQS